MVSRLGQRRQHTEIAGPRNSSSRADLEDEGRNNLIWVQFAPIEEKYPVLKQLSDEKVVKYLIESFKEIKSQSHPRQRAIYTHGTSEPTGQTHSSRAVHHSRSALSSLSTCFLSTAWKPIETKQADPKRGSSTEAVCCFPEE